MIELKVIFFSQNKIHLTENKTLRRGHLQKAKKKNVMQGGLAVYFSKIDLP